MSKGTEERRAAELAAHVEKALAEAPPMTDEQKRTIARILSSTPPSPAPLISEPLTVRIER